jgi:hypothetical protein
MKLVGVAAAIAVLAFVVAGCGGSSDSGSNAAADTAATETAASTDDMSTETTSADTTSADTGTSSTDTNSVTGLSGECTSLAEASRKFSEASAKVGQSGGNDLGATADAFEDLAAAAPDELKDDFRVLADVMKQYSEVLKDVDLKAGEVPSADQVAKLARLGQSLGAQKVQRASAAIATWTTEHCGS